MSEERCARLCDEPVEAPAVGTIDRRHFLAAAAALALAACAGTDSSGGVAPDTVGSSIDVTAYSSLATVGGVALVTVQNSPLAIVRTGDTTYLALSRICPHQGATIAQSGGGFQCPRHGARFDATGRWTGGERTSNMRSYPATYDPTTHKLTIG